MRQLGHSHCSRIEPLSVVCGLEPNNDDTEGRVITANFRNATIVNVYAPCTKMNTEVVDVKREKFEQDLAVLITKLQRGLVPVYLTGNLNVAPTQYDISLPLIAEGKGTACKAQGTDWLYRCASEFQYVNRGPSVDMVKTRLMVGQVGSSLGTSVWSGSIW